MKKAIYFALIAGGMFALSGTGNTAVVSGNFTGVITYSFDETNYLGFGSGSGVLDGLEISGTITYDTVLAPMDTSPDPTYGAYITISTSDAWMPLTIVSISGNPVPVPALPGYFIDFHENQLEILKNDNTPDQWLYIDQKLFLKDDELNSFGYGFDLNLEGKEFIDDSIPLSVELDDYPLPHNGQFEIGNRVGNEFVFSVYTEFTVTSLSLAVIPEPVTIDIKPGSDPNCVNINGHGVIPVAVLGSESFDVANIDQSTLSFGGLDVRVRGNKGPLCGLEDTNSDGFYDLVCQFADNPDYWEPGEDDAALSAELLDGTRIEGTDTICIVP